MITEKIYKGRDNIMSLQLRADGAAVNISGTTRATVKIGDVVIDSQLYSSSFDWSTNGTNGQLDLDFGTLDLIKGLPDGRYTATLTIYDLTYVNGLVWGDFIIDVE